MSQPEKEFRCGQVRATIWLNDRTVMGNDVSIHSIQIEKSYKDGDEWKQSNIFSVSDLPKLATVASESFKYLTLKTREPGQSSE